MDKKKVKKIPTRQEVEGVFRAFLAEVKIATGDSGKTRARFMNFKVKDEIKILYLDSVRAFGVMSFLFAFNGAVKALRSLRNSQKFYAIRSVENFFPNKLRMVAQLVDQDIYDGLMKKFNLFKEAVESTRLLDEFDLNELSRLYWDLLDSIEEAPRLQEARDANARMLARLGKASKKQKARVELLVEKTPEERRREQAEKDTRIADEVRAAAEEFASAI